MSALWQMLAQLGIALLAFGAFLVFMWVYGWVTLLVHEGGHVLVGRLAGIPLQEVRMGAGRVARAARVRGVTWFFHRYPMCGWVMPRHDSAPTRWQSFIFTLGGPLATAGYTGLLFWLLFETRDSGSFAHGLLWVLSFIELSTLVVTMGPRHARMYGREVETDGLLLWRTLFPGPAETAPSEAQRFLVEAWTLGQSGRAEESAARAQDAIRVCSPREEEDVHHVAAHLLMESGKIEDAAACEALLRKAAQHRPETKTMKGTLGGLLAERGCDEEAEPLLRELHQAGESELDLGIAAAYLSVLTARQGRARESAKFRRQALNLLPDLPLVRRVLGLEEQASGER